jgi:hypothetical protein
MLKFKGIRIWPFNLKAMEEKTSLNILYTLVNQTREEDDDNYHSNEEDGGQQWTKHVIAEKLINISLTIEIITNNFFEDQLRYCVNMF